MNRAERVKKVSPAIVVHGGCGNWANVPAARALKGLRAALQAGRRALEQGASALDAVCAAVVVLEDDPLFNAGTGSVKNSDGEVEMDAAVMVGKNLHCGGVACLRLVKNPVLVARRVMEATPHILLAGEGALAFARREGLADNDADTRRPPANDAGQGSSRGGTVGAVALDAAGCLAAATSTGGTSMKLPGRVGDSPIPGAGNYANRFAAASATGNGELMLRTLAAKSVCDLVAQGAAPGTAARRVFTRMVLQAGQSAAMIVLDRAGRPGFFVRAGRMPCAWHVAGERTGARMA